MLRFIIVSFTRFVLHQNHVIITTKATGFMICHTNTQKSVYMLFGMHMDCFHIERKEEKKQSDVCMAALNIWLLKPCKLFAFDRCFDELFEHFVLWNVLFYSNYLPIFQTIRLLCKTHAFIYKHPVILQMEGVNSEQYALWLMPKFLTFTPFVWSWENLETFFF